MERINTFPKLLQQKGAISAIIAVCTWFYFVVRELKEQRYRYHEIGLKTTPLMQPLLPANIYWRSFVIAFISGQTIGWSVLAIVVFFDIVSWIPILSVFVGYILIGIKFRLYLIKGYFSDLNKNKVSIQMMMLFGGLFAGIMLVGILRTLYLVEKFGLVF